MNELTTLPHSPELDLSAIDRADLQPSTKWKYKREMESLLLAGVNPFDYDALAEYADSLKSSRKAFLKSALRLITIGFEQRMKSSATPANISAVQAGVYRLESLRKAVIVPKRKGTKAHTWLSAKQVAEITALCGDDLEGKRDWIILGLLLGAGLRREELAALTFDALKDAPGKHGKTRHLLEVKGKGAKTRVIPINDRLAKHLLEWRQIVGGGRVARSLGRKKQIGESMTAVGVFQLVAKYGRLIGKPELAPHDLRRTFAQLGYEAGIPLTQISTLLGHASVETTQKYLDLALDLGTTASDFIPLSGD